MTNEIDKDTQNGLTNVSKNMEQSFKVKGSNTNQDSNFERGLMESRQRVFNQSPEFKKREIVFGQIQKINNRLSDLEEKVEEILSILKADR